MQVSLLDWGRSQAAILHPSGTDGGLVQLVIRRGTVERQEDHGGFEVRSLLR